MPVSFGPVAEIYDQLMSSIPYQKWVDYYHLLLSRQQVMPKKILDVCCGTGNVCELLYKAGYQMKAFDLSASMVMKAREKAKRKNYKIDYSIQNAIDFSYDEKFDAVYSFFDSLNYITEPEDFKKTIQNVSDHLEPGGSFIFDMNTFYAFEARFFDQEETRPWKALKYVWHGDYNPETLLIKVKMDFWFKDQHFKEVHSQRAYPTEEVISYLVEAGFEKIQVYNSYTTDPPHSKSDRLHYTAVRK